jgi:hypothetical protein
MPQIRFKEKKIVCEYCLNEVPFMESDIFGNSSEDEYEAFIKCPLCNEENQIYNLEEYGIWLEEDTDADDRWLDSQEGGRRVVR